MRVAASWNMWSLGRQGSLVVAFFDGGATGGVWVWRTTEFLQVFQPYSGGLNNQRLSFFK